MSNKAVPLKEKGWFISCSVLPSLNGTQNQLSHEVHEIASVDGRGTKLMDGRWKKPGSTLDRSTRNFFSKLSRTDLGPSMSPS